MNATVKLLHVLPVIFLSLFVHIAPVAATPQQVQAFGLPTGMTLSQVTDIVDKMDRYTLNIKRQKKGSKSYVTLLHARRTPPAQKGSADASSDDLFIDFTPDSDNLSYLSYRKRHFDSQARPHLKSFREELIRQKGPVSIDARKPYEAKIKSRLF